MTSSHTSCLYHPPLHRLTCGPHHNCSHLTGKHLILCAPPQIELFLSVKLTHQQATDLVLVANPNGPHLRLLKQSIALVVFSLRPIDRLAIVTYSSDAARAFPLRRMTSYGKRTALLVIDRSILYGASKFI
jgi:hypothetical protein